MDNPTITLGSGSDKERQIKIVSLIRSEMEDHRLVTIARDEENGYLLAVENHGSSGRAQEAKIYLSEESLHSLFFMYTLFLEHEGKHIGDIAKNMIDKCERNKVEYELYLFEENNDEENNQEKERN